MGVHSARAQIPTEFNFTVDPHCYLEFVGYLVLEDFYSHTFFSFSFCHLDFIFLIIINNKKKGEGENEKCLVWLGGVVVR